MKTLPLFLMALLLSAPSFAKDRKPASGAIVYDCNPELKGDQAVEISLNYSTSRAYLKVEGAAVEECKNAKFSGEEESEEGLRIRCAGNKTITFRQDGDETILDLSALAKNLRNGKVLKDDRYMCSLQRVR